MLEQEASKLREFVSSQSDKQRVLQEQLRSIMLEEAASIAVDTSDVSTPISSTCSVTALENELVRIQKLLVQARTTAAVVPASDATAVVSREAQLGAQLYDMSPKTSSCPGYSANAHLDALFGANELEEGVPADTRALREQTAAPY